MGKKVFLLIAISFMLLAACGGPKTKNNTKNQTTEMSADKFTGADGEVKLITLDPGHFHAALIQKVMYRQMNPVVHIYAPAGQDVEDHIQRINGFNHRAENPTKWDLKVYKGDDFFEKMIAEHKGNLMNVSGNNAKKTKYILETVKAGINVLADKPMAIGSKDFDLLEQAFTVAEENGVLLYDIMTERYEITTMLQRELSQIRDVFGELKVGTPEEPAITKESVHHFYKQVAGKPLKRPAWFFDSSKQGEGLVDINTHLVDLIQWEAFPDVVLSKKDVEIVSAKRWTTELTPAEFKKVTHLDAYPGFLKSSIDGNILRPHCNGELVYKLKGIYAKTSVEWRFKAPEGAKDTHYSIMRGTRCNLIIKQGEKENYKPKLYIESNANEALEGSLLSAVEKLSEKYPGISVQKLSKGKWTLLIPDKYKVGHEAHFGQVTEKYLKFLKEGELPKWEVPNMITKYYTTTKALEVAMSGN